MLRYFRFPILDFGFQSQIANRKEQRAKSKELKTLCSMPLALCPMLYAFFIWAILPVLAVGASPLSMLDSSIQHPVSSIQSGDASVSPASSGEDPHVFYLLLGEKMFRSGEFAGAREAFEKVLELDSQDAQAHYFLGLIEYEERNIEKAKTRFRIAHECISGLMDLWAHEPIGTLPDTKQVQLEFPGGHKAGVYYKNGWYVKPKKRSTSPRDNKSIHSPIMNIHKLIG